MDDCVSGLCLKRSFLEDLRGRSVIEPRSLWRLGWTWALCLILACFAAFAQDPACPTREYIRLGDRLVAVENVTRLTITPPTRNVIGPAETAQFGKSVTCIPAESVRWSVESGPGTISAEGGLYQASASVAAEQVATIKATSTADGSVVARSSITVRPLLVPASVTVAAIGAPLVVTVTKEGAWTASVSSGGEWINITSGASGNGNGQVSFTVAANSTSTARDGALTVAGAAFAVTQAAGSGTVTFSPTGVSGVPYSGAALTVGVTAPADVDWVAVSSDASWLVIDSGGSGRGNGTISYHVVANPSYNSRPGQLIIGSSAAFSVSQNGKPPELTGCSAIPYPVPSTAGGPYHLALGAANLATWSATASPSDILTFVAANGTGSTQIGFNFRENTETSYRSSEITVAVYTDGSPTELKCIVWQAGKAALDIRPNVIALTTGQTAQFSAYLLRWNPATKTNEEYVDNSAVTWSVDGGDQPTVNGTIDQSGAYTVPSNMSTRNVTVRAISKSDSTVVDTATVVLTPMSIPSYSVDIIPNAGGAAPGSFQEFIVSIPTTIGGQGNQFSIYHKNPVEVHFSDSSTNVSYSCKMIWIPQSPDGVLGLVPDNGDAPGEYSQVHFTNPPVLWNQQCQVSLQLSYLEHDSPY